MAQFLIGEVEGDSLSVELSDSPRCHFRSLNVRKPEGDGRGRVLAIWPDAILVFSQMPICVAV